MFETKTENASTIIGQGVKLEGDFTGNGDVELYGEIKGNITVSGFIKIGPNAIVTANIQADSAEIAGHVKGKVIVSQDVELLSTARVTGDVKSQQITIAKGAQISGKVVTDSQPLREKIKDTEPEEKKK